jgi:uncharacterized protein with PQ loop repeat
MSKKSFFAFLYNKDHRHPIDILANANCVISAISLYPQLYALLTGASREGISIVTFLLIVVNSAIWTIYGAHRRSPPLILSSTANLLAASAILALLFMGT